MRGKAALPPQHVGAWRVRANFNSGYRRRNTLTQPKILSTWISEFRIAENRSFPVNGVDFHLICEITAALDRRGKRIGSRSLNCRTERSRPLIIELESWLREQRARVSKNSDTGKAIDYSLKRWVALARFLDDGRLCMTNNAAERELRAVAIGRRNWTFAGSDEGGRRAAVLYTLIATAKLNDVDPQAWLADVLARLPDYPARRIGDLLQWNWHAERRAAA